MFLHLCTHSVDSLVQHCYQSETRFAVAVVVVAVAVAVVVVVGLAFDRLQTSKFEELSNIVHHLSLIVVAVVCSLWACQSESAVC